jgi:acyl carrier protein
VAAVAANETIRKIISVQTGVPASEFTADTYFRTLPEIDSMRILQIILETENAFGVEVPDDATFHVQTIGEFEAMVEELRQRGTSGV